MTWDDEPERIEAMAWAAAIAADPRAVYLDTETTGFGGRAEVVEIAIVDAAGRPLLDTLVRPVEAIPPGASAVHGIFDGDVAAAPGWPDLFGQIRRMLEGRPVVVYNAPFDAGMVLACCGRHGLAAPAGVDGWHCAMRRFAAYRGVRSAGRGGWRWHRLEDAAAHFGVAPGVHRALGDALVCREVVLGMARGG